MNLKEPRSQEDQGHKRQPALRAGPDLGRRSPRLGTSPPARRWPSGWRRFRPPAVGPALLCALALVNGLSRGADQEPVPHVVLNEIMYHPAGDEEQLQFVEIFNSGADPADVSRWSLRGGIEFAFPRGTVLAPGSHRVVCRSIGAFRACYGEPTNVIGTFTGSLSYKGERLELADAQGRVVEAVGYGDRPPWPVAADGHGASLERVCPLSPADAASNWSASPVRPGGLVGGTPGQPNTCASSVPLPLISEVTHTPPRPGEPITVAARIADAAGVASARVRWESWSERGAVAQGETPLKLTQGDERDGRFTAVIPAQPEDHVIRYVLHAEGKSGAVRHSPSVTDLHPTFSCVTSVNTNAARIPFLKAFTYGRFQRPSGARRVQALAEESARPPWSTRLDWGSTVMVLLPGSTEVLVFDHVRLRQRKGGWKVEFQPDRPWGELRTVNLLFEARRSVLCEPLAFELFRRAGVPAPATDHVRLWVDQRALGYQLLVEQPTRAFFRRLGRDPGGNVYKLLWYGQGVTGQHEKKTNPDTGYADLVGAVQGLNQTEGAEQWDFIRQHFDVDELASYFAVNMCIQNWDGFFNNYFAYHDPRPGGKWQIVPWDQDKTWGDHDGASPAYDWYAMPLTFGMKGDKPPHRSWFGGWPIGGAEWWRPPGYFSGPLLANPEFRRHFLSRLRELCDTIFTPEAFGPAVDALEHRLEPEVAYRAQLQRQNPAVALEHFRADVASFRRQLAGRREFILQHLPPAADGTSPPAAGAR